MISVGLATQRNILCFEDIVESKDWRRGRDSNPREGLLPPIDLANRPLQPLGYLSSWLAIRGTLYPKYGFMNLALLNVLGVKPKVIIYYL